MASRPCTPSVPACRPTPPLQAALKYLKEAIKKTVIHVLTGPVWENPCMDPGGAEVWLYPMCAPEKSKEKFREILDAVMY
jgi:hypothetical protein